GVRHFSVTIRSPRPGGRRQIRLIQGFADARAAEQAVAVVEDGALARRHAEARLAQRDAYAAVGLALDQRGHRGGAVAVLHQALARGPLRPEAVEAVGHEGAAVQLLAAAQRHRARAGVDGL